MTPREKELRLTLSKTFGALFSLDYFVVDEGGTCGTLSINYNGVGGVLLHDLVKLGEIFGSKKISVSWETDVQNLVVMIRDAKIPSMKNPAKEEIRKASEALQNAIDIFSSHGYDYHVLKVFEAKKALDKLNIPPIKE